MQRAANSGCDAGFSDAMRGGLGGALRLPGVGEALRREIAGLGLGGSAGSMGIWRLECPGSDGSG